jgi:pimeloyl-ACP methyl ester carboxylesterase
MPTTKIDANGLMHNVVVEGEGTPVVLLHGFPDSSHLWRAQVPALAAAGFRVIAPDLRGMGDTDAPEGVEHYGLMNHIADVRAICASLGVERAHVVGHDWGAALSWLIATVAPDFVDRLVVLSVGRWGTRERSVKQMRNSWYMFMFQFPQAEDFMSRDDWRMFRMWSGDYRDVERAIELLSRPGRLTAGLNTYRANVRPEIMLAPPIELPKIVAPTMGIWSSKDFALTEDQMTASEADVAGGWRYERIEGASHWIPLDAPDRLNELLLDFLG